MPKKVKTIKGNKSFRWTKKGLKKGIPYKAYVKAYVIKDGKKKYVGSSPLMHAYTSGSARKHTNARSLTVNKKAVSLKKGKTFRIRAKVTKLNKNKKLMAADHVAKVRYLSTNRKVATVTKGGRIKAAGAGKCYVYAYAQNGVFKRIKVTVS